MSIKNYKNFKSIDEVRRAKKCPILDFSPLVDSEVYKDMVGMGFMEVVQETHSNEIITRRMTGERSFKDRLGNMGFYHPAFKGARLTSRATKQQKDGYPYFNIKFDGGLRIVEGYNNSASFTSLTTDLTRKCMTLDDYIYKMSFLVKYTIKYQGFPISHDELYSNESYKDIILRKLEENPKNSIGINLPPSIKNEDIARGASLLKRSGIFGKGSEN
jgi:hypothetical protein